MSEEALSPSRRGLRCLAEGCEVVLCDVFGTIHDGAKVFPEAIEALRRFRSCGGVVVLLSNSAMTAKRVASDLERRGMPQDSYDGVVTSADVARSLLSERGVSRIHHIGPASDRAMFEGFELEGVERADLVVCTGFPAEDPTPVLDRARSVDLDLVCTDAGTAAVTGGVKLRFAGLVAQEYRSRGGRVIEAGKPGPAIYATAMAQAATLLGRPPQPSRVLAIGDSLDLDVDGALEHGFRALWINDRSERASLSFVSGSSVPVSHHLARLSW